MQARENPFYFDWKPATYYLSEDSTRLLEWAWEKSAAASRMGLPVGGYGGNPTDFPLAFARTPNSVIELTAEILPNGRVKIDAEIWEDDPSKKAGGGYGLFTASQRKKLVSRGEMHLDVVPNYYHQRLLAQRIAEEHIVSPAEMALFAAGMRKKQKQRPIIFVDLDETLIEAYPISAPRFAEAGKGAHRSKPPGKAFEVDGQLYEVASRKGLRSLLRTLNALGDVYIYTAASYAYAMAALRTVLYGTGESDLLSAFRARTHYTAGGELLGISPSPLPERVAFIRERYIQTRDYPQRDIWRERDIIKGIFARDRLPPEPDRPWVLIDDIPDMRKVAGWTTPGRVIKAEPFDPNASLNVAIVQNRELVLEVAAALDKLSGARSNPPEKYLAGLPPELRGQRIRELEAAAAGEYGYDPLPTDRIAQQMGIVKKGRYTKAAEARGIEHRGDFRETAERALAYYGVATSSQNVSKVAKELEKVFKKGLAAWRTGGHRPGASQQAWAYARVASVLTGGKAYFTADSGNAAKFPAKMRKAIEADPSWSGGSRRNPRSRSGVDAKPVILIGLYSRPDLRHDAAEELLKAGYEDLAYRVAREDNVLHFDMDALPERGDALDHFDRGSAVIAHHLYYDDAEPSRGPGRNFFYNVKNNQIVDLAEAAGIPLFIFGDYPLRARRPDARTARFGGLRVYLPRAVRARPNRKGRFRRGTDPKANYAEIQRMLRTAPSDWKAEFRSGMSTRASSGQKGGSRAMTVENALKILGITAGGNVSGDTARGRHKVPAAVREAAMKGLRLSYENNYGAWDFIGIARAIQLATQPGVPDETRRRMKNYFSRHQRQTKQSSRFGDDSDPSRGYMAWLNWGGDPGFEWVS